MLVKIPTRKEADKESVLRLNDRSKSLLENTKLHQVMTVEAVVVFVVVVDIGCVIVVAIVTVMADIAVLAVATAVGLVPVVAIMGVRS